ncbi:FAD-dependent oxidoreductase [Rhizobium mongolense]
MINEPRIRRPDQNYDVVVIGAGSAGVAAACSASRAGAKTLLIERYAFSGGAATAASVLAYCGLYTSGEVPLPVVGGVAAEILDHFGGLGIPATPLRLKTTGNWIVPLNPEALKLALDRTLADAGVTVLYHAVVSGVDVVEGRVASIDVSGHFGNIRIAAGAFVDASGEGNVCFLADRSLGHQDANVQPASFPLRIGGIPAKWPLDRSVFRDATERFNMSKPPIIARENGGVQLRVPGSSEIWWMALDLETNPCDGETFSLAEITSRECGWRLVECLRQTKAIFKDCYLASTGPQIGIRESRRPKTLGRVTAHDILDAKIPSDTVAFGGWPMEIHHAPGVQEYIPVGGQGYFGIPFDSIRTPIENLLVAGRLIGADREAYGSVRVMGTAFATGQAAGVAAAILLSRSGEVDVDELRERLSQQGALPVLNAGHVA